MRKHEQQLTSLETTKISSREESVCDRMKMQDNCKVEAALRLTPE